jgi:hypothetical protein
MDQRASDDFRARDDDGVAERFALGFDVATTSTSTQYCGAPIIHSRSEIEVPATVARPSPLSRDAPCLFQSPETVGVGSTDCFRIESMLGRNLPERPFKPPWFVPYREAVGVGSNDEDSPSEMRRPEVGSRKTRPLRIEPESGKVGEHASQSGRSQPDDVFDRDRFRPHLFDDAPVLRPES